MLPMHCNPLPCLATQTKNWPSAKLPEPVGILLGIEYGTVGLLLDPVILYHPAVDADVGPLDGEGGLGREGVEDEVVVAVRAVLVGFLELARVLPEALLTLLARKDHLEALQEDMVLLFLVALDAVEPFPAAWRPDGDLRVEDVFAHILLLGKWYGVWCAAGGSTVLVYLF